MIKTLKTHEWNMKQDSKGEQSTGNKEIKSDGVNIYLFYKVKYLKTKEHMTGASLTGEIIGVDLLRQNGKKIHIVFSEIFISRIKYSSVNSLKSAVSSGSTSCRCRIFFLSVLRSNFFFQRPIWYQKWTWCKSYLLGRREDWKKLLCQPLKKYNMYLCFAHKASLAS